MADSAIDDAWTKPRPPPIITEEMIDAAMSKRFNLLENGIDSNFNRRSSSDHNYCIDDEDDLSNSDDSDLYAVSVVDDDCDDDGVIEVVGLESDKDVEEKCKEDEAVIEQNSNEKISSGTMKILNDKLEQVVNVIDLEHEENNSEESPKNLNSSDPSNEDCLNTTLVTDKNKLVNAFVNCSDFSTQKSADGAAIDLDEPLVQDNVAEKVSKQGLVVKPLSNLLKSDLVSNEKTVKVFKCIQGKIEVVSVAMECKTTEDQTSINTSGNDRSITNDFVSLPQLNTQLDKSILATGKDIDFGQKLTINNRLSVPQSPNEEEENDVVIVTEHDSDLVEQIANSTSNKTSSSSCIVSKENNSLTENIANSIRDSDGNIMDHPHLNSELRKSLRDKNNTVEINESATIDNKTCDSDSLNSRIQNNSGKNNLSSPMSSLNEKNGMNYNKNITINIPSNKFTTGKPSQTSFIQRRHILPKINYRYHMNDKLIVSDTLPKNKVLSSEKKKNDNYILPDGLSSQPLLIMAPDLVAIHKNKPVGGLNSSASNPTPITFVRNVIKTTTGEIQSKKTVSMPSHSQNSHSATVKDRSSSSKTWEKVDKFTLNNKSMQQELEEFSINSLKTQVLESEVPPYKPVDSSKFYTCLDCNDRFALESSLRNHRFRKSVLIKYWCRTCSCLLNMYNRCMFLAHIRSHGQLVKNVDMTSLSIEPLPKSLIRFGCSDEGLSDKSQYSCGSALNQTVSSPITVSVSSPNESSLLLTSNSVSKKTVSNDVANISTASDVKSLTNSSKLVKTVPKLVPSDFSIQKVVSKKTLVIDNDNNGNDEGENGSDFFDIDRDNGMEKNDDSDNIVDESLIKIDSVTSLRENSETPIITCTDNPQSNENPACELAPQNNYSTKDCSKTNEKTEKPIKGKSIKGKRKCPECDMPITARISLRKHLQNTNIPGDSSLKCNVCRLILPTKCALKMHLRIHMKLKPFRCPECAIEFHIYDRFIMHLKYTCCHLTKCVRFVCTLCGSIQLSLNSLEQHLLTHHVRPIFKCGICPVAFVNMKSVEKHKEKAHPGMIVQTNSYQQCRLCPEKLIPKKRFLTHLKGHLCDDRLRVYAYQCPTCKKTFFQRTELIYHRMQCDSRDSIIKSCLSTSPPISVADININSISNDGVDNEGEKEIVFRSNKRKLVNDDEIEILEEEKDPLSLEGFQANEEPLREPLIQLCVVCKKEKVVILPGEKQSSQSLCCKKCVRPFGIKESSTSTLNSVNKNKLRAARLKCYKCKICKSTTSMDLKSTYEHFKTYHKELEGQSINEWLIIENKSQQVKRSNTITTAETIKEKYMKKSKFSFVNSELYPVKNEPDEDVKDVTTEKKKPKRCVKPKQKVPEVKSFESGQLITSEDGKTELNCSKCEFIAVSKEELRDHVTCHRTDPNALPCLECGECFVVLPSLEKHLIINHRIRDVDNYIENNKRFIYGSVKNDESGEDGNAKESESGFSCKVCHESFESKTALDKHFRSHGMAFLFKNLL